MIGVPKRTPRIDIVNARWQATCGRCSKTSRVVSATTMLEAWNEIASTEGFCSYEPPSASGMTFEPYPICLACAERELEPRELPRRKRRR